MNEDPLEFVDPETTQDEILIATYRALSKYGYAELTISKIGDEFDKSPSLIYHHYEDKEALIFDCLEFMLEHFEASLVETTIEDPNEALINFLEVGMCLGPDEPDQLIRTLTQLRARASHNDFYEHFSRSDRVFQDHLEMIISEGIEEGKFQDCDPEQVATMLFTTLTGILYRRTTSDIEGGIAPLRTELTHYLESRLGINSEVEIDSNKGFYTK
ncbi:TetR/AcrR family transcriptional regulator [Natronorubrum aibiense]|uniref:TetR family transcriptional regulator n=1 Tax=Natronorubrum aibiense TaxID=348826 RepID=A0A5P9P3D5_9EURY|nr:TetR/AcrR family transcriptional regulator [Natronorubrum aibiense]QFU82340.1 TetR family transcriptional regulator [Natronorubrum aibiense]